MTEVSSIVSLDRDGAGRPTCLRAMTEGDTISDGVLSQNVNDAVTEVNNNSNDWNDAYQVVYDNSASWEAAVAGSVAELGDVGDVNLVDLSDNQIIVYDTGTSKWINVDYSLCTLPEVTLVGVANKDFLIYDSATGKWINKIFNNVLNVQDLINTDITSPTNGQVFVYDSADNKWKNRNINSVIGVVNVNNWNTAYAHATSINVNPHQTDLDQLGDVSIPSTPTNGYVLTWTGSYWSAVAPTGGGATDLDDLTDVVITSPSPYEALIFTSTGSWINSPVSHTWLNGTGTNSHTQIDTQLTNLNTTATIVANNYVNWNTAYSHVSVTGNPHSTDLTDLGDVTITTPAHYQGLLYFTSTGEWNNSQINHLWLNSTGTNTHTQIDSHIAATNNPHNVTAAQVGNTITQWNASAIQSAPVEQIIFTGGGSTPRGVLTYDNVEKEFFIDDTVVNGGNFASYLASEQIDASSLQGSPVSSTLTPTTNQALIYNGSVWTASSISTGGGGVTDHGALTGLADDDHPQYVLSATNNNLSSLVNNHIASAVHWDLATLNSNYINASGDSANAAFFFQTLSATTVSATTYLNVRPNVSSVNSAATTSFTAGGDYDTYLINTTTTSVIAYLPEASSYTNKMITFSKVDDGGSYRSVTVSGAQLVTATNTVILYDPTESVTVISDGTNWYSLDYDRSYGVVFVCKNSTGATLTKGTPVRVSGATGANVLITPASAVNNAVPESPSGFLARVIGVVEHDIPDGEFGHVLTKGSLYKYNTNGFNEGDALYLAASGGLTNIKPTPPYEEIFIGIVTRKQAVNGSLLIDIQNPEHINSIVGFDLASSISERDVIAYDLTTSTFKNYNPSSFNVSSATSATLALSATSALNAQQAPNGFTVTGTLTATTASATTYLNLPSSIATWNASALQGKTLNAAAPTINEILRYNGTQWINDSETQYSLNGELGAGWTINAASGINFTNTATNTFRITANYTSGIWNASALQGSPLSATLVPTAGQALMYNGSVWTASAALFAYTYGSGAPTGGSDGDIYLQTDVEALQVATVSATTVSAINLIAASGEVSSTRLTDYSERKSSPTISSSSLTLDLNAAQVFTVSLNSNISTLTISNTESRANSVQGFTLILTADGTARTITWPGSVKWPSGTGPTLTSTNAKVDILSFVSPDNGTTWYGFIGGQNY